MSGFEAKRIFKIKMVKLLQNAVFNTNWTKTQFSRKSVIPWVDLMQNAFLRKK